MTHFFAYGETELAHLCAADADFAALVARWDAQGIRPQRPVEEDPYYSIIRTINDQLISLTAAASIWGRITARFGNPPAPAALAASTPEEIHACGTTMKKAEYLHDISQMVMDGTLDLHAIGQLPDEEAIAALTSLRGLGRWSAEMLLIHTYERPDVISFGDAAIRRGLCILKHVDTGNLTKALFDELTAPFHPYATTASIYLWQLSHEKQG